MRDEIRCDLPSASAFERTALCPGSTQMIASLPKENLLLAGDDPDAVRGTRLHKAFETDNTLDLDEEDLEIYEQGRETEKKILAQWREHYGITLDREGPRELRLWLNDPQTGEPLASGQLDKHFISGNSVCIIDLKALYCTNLTPAERNWQGRLQAVLASREYDATHVRFALNKAMWSKSDVVDYGPEHLLIAEQSINAALWESRQPGAVRRAGGWCQYCPAKAWCPEAGALTLLPSTVTGIIKGPAEFDPVDMVRKLTDEDRAFLFGRANIIEKILDAVKAQLKALPDERLAQLGLSKKPARNLDPIIDNPGAFNALRTAGISEAELWTALKLSKGELTNAVQRDQGWTADKTKGFLKQVLEPFIEKKQAEASLVTL